MNVTRNAVTSLGLLLTCLVLPGVAAGAQRTDSDYMRQRLAQVNQEITDVADQIRQASEAGLPKDADRQKELNQLLTGPVTDETVKALWDKVELDVGGNRELAQQRRDRLAAIRQPLDALDARIQAQQAEYDRLMQLGGGFDLWGYVQPYGGYSEQTRPLAKEIKQLIKERAELKKQIDAKIHADEDLNAYRTLEEAEAGVNRAFSKYFEGGVPGGLAVKRLLGQLVQLVDERRRLQGMLKSGEMVVVWYNDVNWVHVGTRDEFERQKFRARGSEIWGGRGSEPLKNTQILESRGYPTLKDAIKAVGAAVGQAERKGAPLAFPKVYYVGTIGGAQRMLGFDIINHPDFKEFLPK